MNDLTKPSRSWPKILIGFLAAGVLAAITLPVFTGRAIMGDEARELSRLKQLGLVCKEYATDHGGKYPPTLEALYPQYLSDRALLVSPAAPDKPDGVDYTAGLTDSSPGDTVLIKEKYPMEGKYQVEVCVDDNARIVKVDQWGNDLE